MGGFFGHDYSKYPFAFFSFEHLIVLVLFFFLTFALYRFRNHIFKYDLWIRSVFFITLLSLELFYHLWLYQGGNWDITYTLPFQLCSISLILSLILLITNSKFLANVLYFIGGVGAFAALLTPELFLGFPHFRFFQFFITHMVIIWTALYYVWVKGFYPKSKGVWLAFLFLNLSAFSAFCVNHLTGGNYMFLAQQPENASLIDYLGPYPYYIFSLEGLALGLFWLLWLPFAKKKNVHSQTS
ncbi:YwaF family protein [Pseudoneobacillus rhizosphaerae]|uniref:TIGR02206 family membrane protein n=1 Tax=Pseudoneobacillus rhizosphaerae TaxID=2880968 RepID=A0A9C7LBC8_9BACI|nr:TIGR02206 family membrane protein [Pseudoneobacillus rhizosphaerae]CAG9608793.1 hypothetical protein NEOCIP111885_02510 [Pseudoneobacillus rhizosphaerae]